MFRQIVSKRQNYNLIALFTAKFTTAKANSIPSRVMRFDGGIVTHSKHGHCHVRGELPLLLNDYKIPSILSDSSKLKELVEHYSAKANILRPLYPKEGQLEKIIEDSIIIASCMLSELDPLTDPALKIFTLFWIKGFALDDFVDDNLFQGCEPKISSKFLSYEKVYEIWKWANKKTNVFSVFSVYFNSNYSLPISQIQCIATYYQHVLDELEKFDKDFKAKLYDNFNLKAISDASGSKVLQMDMLKNRDIKNISFHLIHQISNQFSGTLPLPMFRMEVFKEPKLSEAIRNDLIFKLFQSSFLTIMNYNNSIVGLRKDILNGEEKDNIICVSVETNFIEQAKLTLQDHFDQAINILSSSYKDLLYLEKKLYKLYPKDESIRCYIFHVKNILDGSIFACSHIKRYGTNTRWELIETHKAFEWTI